MAHPLTERQRLPDEIAGPRVVAIGRGLPPDRVERIAEGLVAGGIRAFEITLNSPDAFAASVPPPPAGTTTQSGARPSDSTIS